MTVHPFPTQKPTPTTTDPAATSAALDVLRERHMMLVELGYSEADEDTFVRDEMLIVSLQTIDAASVATSAEDRRTFLVRSAALLIAEIERLDRAMRAIR